MLLTLSQIHQITQRQIVITGPHRTGTTIAAKIIANQLNYQCYLEEGFGNDFGLLNGRVHENYHRGISSVYQVPLLMGYCYRLPEFVAVVVMRRKIEDILDSQKRIGWNEKEEWKRRELEKFDGIEVEDDLDMPICEAKYKIWEEMTEGMTNAYELEYDSLSEHRFWVEKEKRKNFTPRQTEHRKKE